MRRFFDIISAAAFGPRELRDGVMGLVLFGSLHLISLVVGPVALLGLPEAASTEKGGARRRGLIELTQRIGTILGARRGGVDIFGIPAWRASAATGARMGLSKNAADDRG